MVFCQLPLPLPLPPPLRLRRILEYSTGCSRFAFALAFPASTYFFFAPLPAAQAANEYSTGLEWISLDFYVFYKN